MRIGIVGAADIVKKALIDPARLVPDVEVCAVASRNPERAAAFAKEHGIRTAHPSYQALIEDDSLDAVYIPLPNSLHAEWTIAALEAGRHVMCEKPLASNADQAAGMVAVAERTGFVLFEAFHWRYHPVAHRMLELSRRIGPIEQIEAWFDTAIPAANIRYDLGLAGGSFMDLGCYCMHMVRTIMGSEPEVVRAVAVEGPKGVDLSMNAELSFAGNVRALMRSSMAVDRTSWPGAMTVRARGQRGTFEVLNPMAPQLGHRILAILEDGSKVDEVLDMKTSYEYQLRAFQRVVAGEETLITGGADSVRNMAAIDSVYLASGLGIRR